MNRLIKDALYDNTTFLDGKQEPSGDCYLYNADKTFNETCSYSRPLFNHSADAQVRKVCICENLYPRNSDNPNIQTDFLSYRAFGTVYAAGASGVVVNQTTMPYMPVYMQSGSQVQLYVEGPADKWFTLLAVEQNDHAVPIPKAYDDLEGVAYLGGRDLAELFHAEREGTRIALTEAGRPNVQVTFPQVTPHSVGQYIQMMQIAVAVMGEHYDVDAFDQPGVEAGKIAAYALMGRSGYEQRRSEIEAARPRNQRLV